MLAALQAWFANASTQALRRVAPRITAAPDTRWPFYLVELLRTYAIRLTAEEWVALWERGEPPIAVVDRDQATVHFRVRALRDVPAEQRERILRGERR